MTKRNWIPRPSRRDLFRGLGLSVLIGFAGLTGPNAAWADRDNFALGVPGVRGGVVTTSEPVAAEVGAEILRKGGNAIDAAAGIQFALTVAEPQSSGIGGGGFMMIHLADSKKTFVIDSRERAPAAADPDMFRRDSDPSLALPFSIRSTSGLGVGVPGTVLGVATALDRWGTISLAEALAPAIDLAEKGIRVSTRLADSVTSSRLSNEPGDPAYEEARDVFRPGGVPVEAGDLLKQPDLANTLRMIADQGTDAFYKGEIAEAIVKTQLNTRTVSVPLTPADQAKLVGRMELSDLENYDVAIRAPVTGRYRDFEIVSMPPPSSGGLTVIYILKLLEQFPIGDAEEGFGFGSAQTLHVMIEAMRLAFVDRAVWMGDTDFVDLPTEGIISDGYLATRKPLISLDGRRPDALVEPGDPRPFDTAFLPTKTQLARTIENPEEGVNTTHFTVVDRHGNIVTYTSTIESAWGTGLMVPGYGFLLNNELTDFNSIPAANPDPFNPGANDAAANKRPRSSMSPTFVFHRGRPVAAYGSPGGSSIINSVVNISLNLIDHRRPVQEAIELPRLSQTSATGRFATPSRELGFSDEAIEGLIDLGHSPRSPSVIGSVQAVVVDRETKLQYGGADERRIGRVISVRLDEIEAGGDDDDDDDDD